MSEDRGILLAVNADDEDWEIDLFDFRGTEWRAMKQHVPGLTMASAIAGMDRLDAEVLAVLLWAWRHRDEPDLTFDHCLDSISLRSVVKRERVETDETPDASDPEG